LQVELSAWSKTKGGASLENLLAEPNRVRRVENIRERMREADLAHETTVRVSAMTGLACAE
jgi:hypothetical protein